MSIYGLVKTALKPYALPGKPEGRRYQQLMLDLSFSQQIAGTLIANFCEPNIIYPAQFAQAGDEGLRIIITVIDSDGNPVDISSATSKSIIVKKPALTTLTSVASFLTNGMDGKIYIELPDTALTDYGFYFVQAQLVIASQTKSTRTGKFQVKENLA